MRTTLSLDDDVLLAVRERARREHRSAGEVLSDLARRALTVEAQSGEFGHAEGFHGFEPFPHRGEAISNALIEQLREEDAV